MQNFILCLSPFGKESQFLKLRPNYSNAIIAKTDNKVFNNLTYSGQLRLDNPESVSNFRLFVNDTFVETVYNADGNFQIAGKPFIECYGYVQLTVKFVYRGDSYNLTTDYISVLVRNARQNESIQRMAAYVYRYSDLLFMPKNLYNLKYKEQNSLELRLHLLKDFVRIFTVNYPQFKNNSQFTTVQSEYIDRFEKLRNFSANTVKFIAQHPDELRMNSFAAGVQVGRYNYQPEKTLITNNVTSYDIMENRAIVNFLYTLLDDIKFMKSEIEKLLVNQPTAPAMIDNYVESNFFIYSNATEKLNNIMPELVNLESQFSRLLFNYAAIYDIKGDKLIALPKPTIIFLSVPQYRQAYDCMANWFNLGAFNSDGEKYIFNFMKISALYEVYVLLHLINYLRRDYYFTKRDNIYFFKRDESAITIYYQPIIYNRVNETGLYRNNSIKFSTGEDLAGGSYYVPDFVIKVDNDSADSAKYIIIDAKYSTVENVKLHHVSNLVFKYLFSLSPINFSDEIVALYIINGQSEGDTDDYSPIYDKKLGDIKPDAEIITLTENDTNNFATHDELLSRIFKLI